MPLFRKKQLTPEEQEKQTAHRINRQLRRYLLDFSTALKAGKIFYSTEGIRRDFYDIMSQYPLKYYTDPSLRSITRNTTGMDSFWADELTSPYDYAVRRMQRDEKG